MKLKHLILFSGLSLSTLVAYQWVPAEQAAAFHRADDVAHFKMLQADLPVLYNGLFSGSGACVQCHGSDPNGIASTTSLGEDVNVVDDWKGSIMANSAKDPYWKAKVKESVLINPEHQELIEDKCTSCHAPLGRHSKAILEGEAYSMIHLSTDSLGQDGVSCVACHQQSPQNIGIAFSGDLNFETSPLAYGPYESPLISPMAEATGYIPEYSEHITKSEVCAGCHTLITNTLDLDGMYTGTTFVEQATYHEWLNSQYSQGELTTECQACHMPSLGGKQPIILAAGFDTPPRSPFSIHTFSGANTLMLNILKDNAEALNASGTTEDFEASIAATTALLQQQSLLLNTSFVDRTADTLFAAVEMSNLAGHKFPSGYPARRLFLQISLVDAEGNIVFENGLWDDQFYLVNEDQGYEPHYETIRSEEEVQIYEMVMGDAEGNYTSILERGYNKLKDNRLVPRGFSSTHSAYDTTRVDGLALMDDNFNLDEFGNEGNGKDLLFLNLPTLGNDLALTLEVKAYYQSIPPKFVDELFAFEDSTITAFENMYNAADRTPVLVRESALEMGPFVGLDEREALSGIQFLHQSGTQQIQVSSKDVVDLKVYSASGSLVLEQNNLMGVNKVHLGLSSGVYVVHLTSGKTSFIERIWVQQ